MSGAGIVVVSAADERYVMPLTVMVRSLLENLKRGTPVDLYIFQDNVGEASRQCAEASWKPFPVRAHWIAPDKSKVEDAGTGRAFAGPPTVYFRLFAGELLPPEVTKAIYLDADIMVLGDLSELWDRETGGNLALAVPDAYARAFHLGRLSRVTFREEIRFDLHTPYFNSGVLVIDVAGWRREHVGARALRILQDYPEDLTFCDQDALNCVLQGRWGALGPTWNFHELPDCLFLWNQRVYRRNELPEAASRPKVVHFTARPKPWMKWCFHSRTGLFHDYFSRTQWPAGAIQGRSGLAGLVRTLIILPHSRLNQFVWRESAAANGAGRVGSALRILVTNPWMLVTYPLWQMLIWLYFLLAMPVDRRRLFRGRG
jgi:lipopolysaccharide biosynthesis glycosyltransferase